jgi:hypothetical protein
VAVTNGYDNLLRRNTLSILDPQSAILASATYGYDSASRLQTVATYSHLANSPLVEQITWNRDDDPKMTTMRSHDQLNRLTRIASYPGATSNAAPVASFQYAKMIRVCSNR